jgi:hypothetical protein
MINGLGVPRLGVGGIEAEAAMLGPADLDAAARRCSASSSAGELPRARHADRPGA